MTKLEAQVGEVRADLKNWQWARNGSTAVLAGMVAVECGAVEKIAEGMGLNVSAPRGSTLLLEILSIAVVTAITVFSHLRVLHLSDRLSAIHRFDHVTDIDYWH
ncbi:hypothetical protein HY387_00315 [Candidatus Daviesbacteria bacterium]|nr:hypothetical protein [Candidatus Daviesbacteria bacterium]